MIRPLTRACVLGALLLPLSSALAQDDAPARRPAEPLPEAKEIIARSIEAMGGANRVKELKSFAFDMTSETPMGEQTIRVASMRPNKVSFNQPMPTGGNITTVYVDDHAWMSNTETEGFELMPTDEIGPILPLMGVHTFVLSFNDLYQDMKTIARVEFGGEECFQIEMFPREGEETETVFFNARTGLYAGQKSTVYMKAFQGDMEVEVLVTKWETNQDATIVTGMSVNMMGQEMPMVFSEFSFNEVKAESFDMPEEVRELIKEQEAKEVGPTSRPGDDDAS